MPTQDLSTNLETLTQELDEVQSMIDRAKNTYIGSLPQIRSALDRRQLKLDAQRIKLDAAKKYIATLNK